MACGNGYVTITKLLKPGSLGECGAFLGWSCVLRSSRMGPLRMATGISSPWGRRKCGVAVLHRDRRGQEHGKVQYAMLPRAVLGASVIRCPVRPALQAAVARIGPTAHHDQWDAFSDRSTPAHGCAWRLPV